MVGQETLTLLIVVRIHAGEPMTYREYVQLMRRNGFEPYGRFRFYFLETRIKTKYRIKLWRVKVHMFIDRKVMPWIFRTVWKVHFKLTGRSLFYCTRDLSFRYLIQCLRGKGA